MCRFLVYKGSDEILLSKLILNPAHSILKQSFDARLRLDTRRGQNNADGFGITFYTDPKLGLAPCLFTSTIPAWNCANLQRLATKTASRLVFAHVRATTEASLSEDNCHPFCHGSLSFMHNGGLGGWRHVKRRLGERLADKWYLEVKGGTDSEWTFALFLDTLERMGHDPSGMPERGFGAAVLRRALLRTIAIVNELIDAIPESVVAAENVDTRSLLNFAVTDGVSVVCTRYISSATDQAASLYYSSGTQWEESKTGPGPRLAPDGSEVRDYQMARKDKGADIVLVASEPLTFERENWINVPTNSILTIHNQTVMVHPILDKYYNRSPTHPPRSAAYVHTKGLSTNEKAAAAALAAASLAVPSLLPSSPPLLEVPPQEDLRKLVLTPVIPYGSSASRVNGGSGHGNNNANPSLALRAARPPISPLASLSSDAAAGGGGPSSSSGGGGGITSPTSGAAAASRPDRHRSLPSQGNIKKKRRSLQSLEQLQAVAAAQAAAAAQAGGGDDSDTPLTPVTPVGNAGGGGGGAGGLGPLGLDAGHPAHPLPPGRSEYGNPNKIAQYFPELTLG